LGCASTWLTLLCVLILLYNGFVHLFQKTSKNVGSFFIKTNIMKPNKEKNNEKHFETLMPAPWAIAFKKPNSMPGKATSNNTTKNHACFYV
jgi:hypothetical protein